MQSLVSIELEIKKDPSTGANSSKTWRSSITGKLANDYRISVSKGDDLVRLLINLIPFTHLNNLFPIRRIEYIALFVSDPNLFPATKLSSLPLVRCSRSPVFIRSLAKCKYQAYIDWTPVGNIFTAAYHIQHISCVRPKTEPYMAVLQLWDTPVVDECLHCVHKWQMHPSTTNRGVCHLAQHDGLSQLNTPLVSKHDLKHGMRTICI